MNNRNMKRQQPSANADLRKNTVRRRFLYAIKNKTKQPWMITKSGQVVKKLELF